MWHVTTPWCARPRPGSTSRVVHPGTEENLESEEVQKLQEGEIVEQAWTLQSGS